jgi:hypothetical protein
MRSLHALGHHAVVAALTTVVSAGVVLALASPAAASDVPAGISFLTAPPATAVVGASYAVGVSGGGADTPVALGTQDASVCSVAGTVVTFDAEGVCLVEAHQDADATHAEADAAQLIMVETAAPSAAPVVAPRVTATRTAAKAANSHGWYRSAVTVSFTCTAGSSRVTSCPAPVSLARSAARQSVTRRVVAADGGSATITVGPLSIDRTAPTVAISGVRSGHKYRGAGPAAHCKASDRVSGVATCRVTSTRHGHAVTVRATAVDRAGNAHTKVVRYRVHVR